MGAPIPEGFTFTGTRGSVLEKKTKKKNLSSKPSALSLGPQMSPGSWSKISPNISLFSVGLIQGIHSKKITREVQYMVQRSLLGPTTHQHTHLFYAEGSLPIS